MIEQDDGSKKQTKNTWKYLSFVLMGILAFGVTVTTLPQAMAKPPEGTPGEDMMAILQQIREIVLGIDEKVAGIDANVTAIDSNLADGKYGQLVVLTRHPQPFIAADDSDHTGFDTVTRIPDGQEGVLHRTDCNFYGSDPPGLGTSNRVFLERGGVEAEFQLCSLANPVDLEPGDLIRYECEIATVPHPDASCDAEISLWMTLRNT